MKLGPKILLLVLLVGGAVWAIRQYVPHKAAPVDEGSQLFTLSGSNTIGANLAPKLAQAFLTQKGAIGISTDRISPQEIHVRAVMNGLPSVVVIKASGTSNGFSDASSGKADSVMASRPISGTEAVKLAGVREKVLGLDGVVIVANQASSITSLTKTQTAELFSTGRMNVYAFDEQSGTYDTFKTLVMRTSTLTTGAKRYSDATTLVTAVSMDPNGIGFVSLAAAQGVKQIPVAASAETLPLLANQSTIRTEAYPLTRRLYLYSKPGNPTLDEFVTFAGSPAGQNIVEETGFVAQKIETIKTSIAMTAAPQYKALAGEGQRIDVDLRFMTGSSTLDSKALDDIPRIVAAVQGHKVMLVGFSDSTGSPASNIALSLQRANTVASVLQSHGVATSAKGLGAINPVDSNDTPEGREKNRRVEVWLQ